MYAEGNNLGCCQGLLLTVVGEGGQRLEGDNRVRITLLHNISLVSLIIVIMYLFSKYTYIKEKINANSYFRGIWSVNCK